MMGDLRFYHLTRSTAAQALLQLLPKAIEGFGQVELRGSSRDQMHALDRALWLGPEDSFLAHGLQGKQNADQPVLLCWDAPATERPCLIGLSHVDLQLEHVASRQRTCVMFDGSDESAVQFAREQWKTFVAEGLTAEYWKQEQNGGWKKAAQSA